MKNSYIIKVIFLIPVLITASVNAAGINAINSHKQTNSLFNTIPNISSSDDCTCDGKLTTLILQYNGDSTNEITVIQKNNETIFQETVAPGQNIELIGTLKAGRGKKNITLGPWIDVYFGNTDHQRIHTSCSIEINIGDVIGDFLVISGTSRNNGQICGELPPNNDVDLGDAPLSYGEASHIITSNNPYLGTTPPDIDVSPQHSSDASEDDRADNGIDDEGDSIFIVTSRGTIPACDSRFLSRNSITTMEITTHGNANLNAWIDWNLDGLFSNNEQIITQIPSTGGSILANITIPGDAVMGSNFLRLRYSSDIATSATGSASDGEVEDCAIFIN